jgi:hypothetical protein
LDFSFIDSLIFCLVRAHIPAPYIRTVLKFILYLLPSCGPHSGLNYVIYTIITPLHNFVSGV